MNQRSVFKMLSVLFTVSAWNSLPGEDAVFAVDASEIWKTMGNKVSNVNQFSLQGTPAKFDYAPEYNPSKFVKFVQIMQATGGNEKRDLFHDPNNRKVLDDYKFDELLQKCRAILQFGAKPHIKTGNVPLKFCKEPKIGGFGVNVYPPDDFQAYYKYIHAIADALVKEFGRDEVRTWRFGIMTEYENPDWFRTADGDPDHAFEAFCKLYECTASALQDAIGKDVCIGTHAMASYEDQHGKVWDKNRFIRYAAEKKLKLDFVNASFYDQKQGVFAPGQTLAQTVRSLHSAARMAGLKDLLIGVDEGRVLYGVPGKDSKELTLRITGDTWQAGYDARTYRICFDEEIDYFSSWGFFSTGLCCPQGALPSVSYHVAEGVSKFAGMNRLTVKKRPGNLNFGQRFSRFFGTGVKKLFGKETDVEIECVAALSPDKNKVYLMLYQFLNDPGYDTPATVKLQLNKLPFQGTVKVIRKNVDDSCNFFPQWRLDRKKYGITEECFSRSPDDSGIEYGKLVLADEAARKLFFEKLKPQYAELARMKIQESTVPIKDHAAEMEITIAPNGVVFLELTN